MSITYEIRCVTCGGRDGVWIGQGTTDFYVYGDEDTRKQLTEFLKKHEGHVLMFDNNYTWDAREDEVEILKENKIYDCEKNGDKIGEFLYSFWRPPIVAK